MKSASLTSWLLQRTRGWYLVSTFFVLLLAGPVAPTFGGVNTGGPCDPAVDNCDGNAAKWRGLTRTFAPRDVDRAGAGLHANFALTRDDFLRLFAVGREVHINLSPEGEVYEMNIGFTDLVTAQAWQLPEIPFEGPSIWAILDPAETPHGGLFPEATHALVSMNDQVAEGTVYLYYEFGEEALVILGEVVEPPNDAPLETYEYNFPLTLFPMDAEMQHHTEEQFEDGGLQVLFTQDVSMHGFGTFELSDEETLDAGAFYDDLVWRDVNEPDPEVVLDFETYYSILGSDGTWFSFYIADPPDGSDEVPIQGDVFIEYVEYWRVVDPSSTAIEAEVPAEAAAWSIYPNPATDVLRFSAPASVSLYDVLGRQVRSGTSVDQLDVGGLPPGLYLVRTEAGASKPVIIH